MRVLVIEDDAETAAFIRRGLMEYGHQVACADNGRDGLFLASDDRFDVIVLDRMLPGIDGVTVVELLRRTATTTPALFLSALGKLDQRISGLEAGGDDYLTKPFAFAELLARLKALTRRHASHAEARTLEAGGLILDRLAHKVERDGSAIDLQPREFRLLEYLLLHKGEVVTRTMLLEQVWDYHFEPKTSVVETHMSRLRAKVDKPFASELIRTVRGAGYVLADA